MVAVADFVANPEGSGRHDSGHLLSHLLCPFFDIEWGGVRLRIDQQQDPALLFRCLT
jgi:hypothetical protein